MTVNVVIVTKDGCEPNCYVFANRDDAIKLFCEYKALGVSVVLEEVEVK